MKRVSRKYVGKCFKNGAEIAPDRLPGTSWHSFWPSWALLGLISGLLGPPGGHFGSPGSHFGSLLALLGLSWRSWALRGSQNGSKMAPKMAPKWLPGGLPEGSRHWGTLFCKNSTGMHTGAEFSKSADPPPREHPDRFSPLCTPPLGGKPPKETSIWILESGKPLHHQTLRARCKHLMRFP